MREPSIVVQPRPALEVGQKVRLDQSPGTWTVRGVTKAGQFVILTQPFNLEQQIEVTTP